MIFPFSAIATLLVGLALPVLFASTVKASPFRSSSEAPALQRKVVGLLSAKTDTVPIAVSGRSGHLVIFFHGIRGRGSAMDVIANSWKSILPNTKFVAPDAPYAHRSGGHQWFAVDDQVLRPDRIEAARRAFDDLVSDIVKREGFENDLEDVAFVAVSQGAIMALDAVASGRWKVGALVSFAGLLPLPPTSPSSGTAVLLLHGGEDRTIPSASSVAANGQLKSAGYDVTLKVFPDVGHTISSDEASQAATFLREKLYR